MMFDISYETMNTYTISTKNSTLQTVCSKQPERVPEAHDNLDLPPKVEPTTYNESFETPKGCSLYRESL